MVEQFGAYSQPLKAWNVSISHAAIARTWLAHALTPDVMPVSEQHALLRAINAPNDAQNSQRRSVSSAVSGCWNGNRLFHRWAGT